MLQATLATEPIEPPLRLLTKRFSEPAVRSAVLSEICAPCPMWPPLLLSIVSDSPLAPFRVRLPAGFSVIVELPAILPVPELGISNDASLPIIITGVVTPILMFAPAVTASAPAVTEPEVKLKSPPVNAIRFCVLKLLASCMPPSPYNLILFVVETSDASVRIEPVPRA